MPLWSTFCDVPRYGSSAELGGPSASAKFNEGIGLFDFSFWKGLTDENEIRSVYSRQVKVEILDNLKSGAKLKQMLIINLVEALSRY